MSDIATREVSGAYRIERDSLGEVQVPVDAWYGAQTQRAIHNFPITGLLPHPTMVRATVFVKRAAAEVNRDLGQLDPERANAIIASAERVLNGELLDQWRVDPIQAGAGTSHNMNTNEGLANLANVSLGGKRGEYKPVHPNDHVNMAQSTNDVFPTAMRIASLLELQELYPSLDRLQKAFAASSITSSSRAAHTCRTPYPSGSGRSSPPTPARWRRWGAKFAMRPRRSRN